MYIFFLQYLLSSKDYASFCLVYKFTNELNLSVFVYEIKCEAKDIYICTCYVGLI